MKTVPHIDIVGDDRIQTILDDPDIFELRAIRAETLLDWIPDLGTYLAPSSCRSQNGIFRTSGLAQSGVPAILRHRFWLPEDVEAVTGTRYVGLLIYDGVDDDYVFELSAGSEGIGAIAPWRHDNRRHLVVATVPAEILGGHIPFTVKALGTGRCYLESVLFMRELPKASTFIPVIDRLSARVVSRNEDSITTGINCITSEPARLKLSAVIVNKPAHASIYGETTEFDVLHSVTLPNFKPDEEYEITVLATEPGGAEDKAVTVLTTQALTASTQTLRVPVEILKTDDLDFTGLPLTFGVPVARGSMISLNKCTMRVGNWSCDGQARVHARWPDGSARWALIDVPAPDIPKVGRSISAQVILSGDHEMPGHPLSWHKDTGGFVVEDEKLRVSVTRSGPLPALIERRLEDGSWQSVLSDDKTCLTAILGNGLQLVNGLPENITLEESGPKRVVIRYELPIGDDRGLTHFRSVLRVYVYTRMPFIRLAIRTTVVSPILGPAFGSDDLDHLTDEMNYLQSAITAEEGEATSVLRVKSLELLLPFPDTVHNPQQRIVHEHDRAYRVESLMTGGQEKVKNYPGHFPGYMELQGQDGFLGVCVRDFWRTYPKALRCSQNGLAVEVLPTLSSTDLPEEDELWHKLYFWRDRTNNGYKLKVGMTLSVDIVIGIPEKKEESKIWQSWLDHSVVVRPTLDYLNATDVLLPIAAKSTSPLPVYEALMDQSASNWLDHVARRHEYGFVNYGDTYSDKEYLWSNNEYDSPFCAYLEFLRGGDPLWFNIGSAAALHLVDIDTCNHSRDSSQIGAQYVHTPGHMGGYLPPYFRSKTAGSASIPSHSWVEGGALHYLLTGDEAVSETIRTTGMRLARDLKTYDFMNMREPGWLIIHLCGLARMMESPYFENAATVVVNRVLDKQEPGGGWEHPLSEAHCLCEPPREHGEAGFMVGVVLSALRRYHNLTGDNRVPAAIVGGAKWLIKNTYVPEVGHFRYTSCPTLGGPGPVFTLQIIEGLADAYLYSRDPLIAAVLQRGLSDIGKPSENIEDPRYGRSLSSEARYIPFMLYVLSQLDLLDQ